MQRRQALTVLTVNVCSALDQRVDEACGPVARRAMQGCAEISVATIWVGAAVEQNSRNSHLPMADCQMQRLVQVSIHNREVSTRSYELRDKFALRLPLHGTKEHTSGRCCDCGLQPTGL